MRCVVLYVEWRGFRNVNKLTLFSFFLSTYLWIGDIVLEDALAGEEAEAGEEDPVLKWARKDFCGL